MTQAGSFGQLIRRYRVAVGLTQEALAKRAGVSLRTITNLERSRVARSHESTLLLIAKALALTVEQLAELERRLPGGAAPLPDVQTAVAALPVYDTTLIGRDTELAELRMLCTPEADIALFGGLPIVPRGSRLLTLIGAQGQGKTRLAVALANTVASAYREGVRFVELTGLTDPEGVTRAVARAIGLTGWSAPAPLDPLIAALQPQQLLIVLDGAEQALDPCAAFVDTVLRRCPAVQLVVTSRVALQVEGEQVRRVAPLALPETTTVVRTGTARRAALPAIRASAAVRLFADCAALVAPNFVVSLDNAAPLDALCRALGGIPLAIELAAAQVSRLTLPDLVAQLATLPAESPLEGVIAWSYRLLPAADRALFHSLAAFVGCWPDDAATICARLVGNDAASEGLQRLIDAGLVQRERYVATVAYRLPRPVRAYALAQLRASGDESATKAGQLAWCLQLVQAAVASAGQDTADARITAADDNLCHALIWALAHDPASCRPLAAALRDYLLAARPRATGWARLLPLLERTASSHYPALADQPCEFA